jgi:protocatechuate 3,4-dioxygenase beta subunit
MKTMLAVAALLMLALSNVVLAQVDRATLTGTIKDAGGAIVAGATVSITNVATNVAARQQTTDTGSYLFVNLIPGR